MVSHSHEFSSRRVVGACVVGAGDNISGDGLAGIGARKSEL